MTLRSRLAHTVDTTDIPAAMTTVRALRPDTARYFGWTGHDNLGDECVRAAAAALVAPHDLVEVDHRTQPSRRIADRRRVALTVIGGGTLIGGGSLDAIAASVRRSRGTSVALGSGVIDPDFPHSYGGGVAALDDWCDVLRSAVRVGVRGPRSADLLHERDVQATVIGDPAIQFLRPPGHWQRGDRTEPGTLAVNIGTTKNRSWHPDDDVLGEIRLALADYLDRGYRLRFVSVRPEDAPITDAFCTDLLRETGLGVDRAEHVSAFRDAEQFQRSILDADGLLALKLHAGILGMAAGLPTLLLEYHPKASDFAASVDALDRVLRVDELDHATLVQRLDATLELPDDRLARLHAEMDRRKRQQQAFALGHEAVEPNPASSTAVAATVLTLTHNSEDTLARSLESAASFDDRLVVDGRSNDLTRSVAVASGARVIDQPAEALAADGRLIDYSAARQVGMEAVSHSWVLVLDSDEYATPELTDALRTLIAEDDGTVGRATVQFRHRYRGEVIHDAAKYPFRGLRVFHRERVLPYEGATDETAPAKPGYDTLDLDATIVLPVPPFRLRLRKYAHYLRIDWRAEPSSEDTARQRRATKYLAYRLAKVRTQPAEGPRFPLHLELVQLAFEAARCIAKAHRPTRRAR